MSMMSLNKTRISMDKTPIRFGNVFSQEPYNFAVGIGAANQEQVDYLKDTLTPLLRGIDPMFKMVNIQSSCMHHRTKGIYNRFDKNCDLTIPCLAITILTKEYGSLGAKALQKKLQKPPWRFHHKIERWSEGRLPVCLGRQDFYTLGYEYPLCAVCPSIGANEYLRFTIFTNNFNHMVEFYQNILGILPKTRRCDFCLFELYTQPGFGVQFAVKETIDFKTRQLSHCFLHLNLKSSTRPGYAILRDPDGNFVINSPDVEISHFYFCPNPYTCEHSPDSVTPDTEQQNKEQYFHDSGIGLGSTSPNSSSDNDNFFHRLPPMKRQKQTSKGETNFRTVFR